ncbi:MAG: SDR family oxidoreductase [Terriglobia bacterium]
MSDLIGQVAVITGAGGELGRPLAEGLAAAGARVALLDVGAGYRAADRLARGWGSRGVALRVDITSEAQVRRGFRALLRRWARLDTLINNAGITGPTAPFEKIARPDWERILAVNLTGAFLCAREAARVMKRQRSGHILQIASVAGKIAYPLRLPYACSKWALIGFTQTLAQELGPDNIRVNAICPGPVAGAAMERIIQARARALRTNEGAVRRRYLRALALGRMATPTDVVAAVLFLCSPSARNITGQALDVSAGWAAQTI